MLERFIVSPKAIKTVRAIELSMFERFIVSPKAAKAVRAIVYRGLGVS